MTEPGSTDAVAVLVANHRRFLEFLTRRTGSREEAEDVLQAAFVRGVERAGQLRDEESVVAWFFRVLRNELVDRGRRRTADQRALSAAADRLPDDDPDLEREICTCVLELLPLLNEDYAELIRRVDVAGEPIGSVAAATGSTPGSARVRLHRARAALRREVERTCRTCATHGCLDCTCGRPGGC